MAELAPSHGVSAAPPGLGAEADVEPDADPSGTVWAAEITQQGELESYGVSCAAEISGTVIPVKRFEEDCVVAVASLGSAQPAAKPPDLILVSPAIIHLPPVRQL